jgi:glutathione S-transferase
VLRAQPYLERDGFSVADVAVGGLLLYLPLFYPSLSLAQWPLVEGYTARLARRRAYALTLGARIGGAAVGTAPPAPPTRGGKPAPLEHK